MEKRDLLKKRYHNIKYKKLMGEQILSFRKQYASIKKAFPGFDVTWKNNIMVIVGNIKPTVLSRIYTVQIWYGEINKKYIPKVTILNPKLEKNSKGEKIPHMYSEERLCLYFPKYKEFTSGKYISKTIIPWISLWLYYYEIWHITGKWLGGGIHPTERKLKKFSSFTATVRSKKI